MRRVWLLVVLMLTFLVVAAWASDFVTLQGERTIYTAECEGGQWQDSRCTGRMVAGKRYRYHASKERGEVVLQVVGSSAPAGRLSNCDIRDGRNWVCPPAESPARSWTLRMEHGAPVARQDLPTRSDRQVSKWRWHLLEALASR
ncbi:MAG: hypothetical protein K8R60_19645 [Burkholderiales bacterium]|nr:hypothetical protein [Burkholderiales bacterium]